MALPKLSPAQPIVNPDRTPSSPFLGFVEATRNAQTATDQRQDDFAEDLQEQANDLADALEELAAAVEAIQSSLSLGQSAQQAANGAQETADAALADGTVSGAATDPVMDLTFDDDWEAGPQVDLTGVVAGDLTIIGSGPQQDEDVTVEGFLTSAATVNGEWRVVEIDAGIETTVFSGTFRARQTQSTSVATVTNLSTEAATAFSDARTSTGTISYRLDARKVGAGAVGVSSLTGYLFVRRAA